MDVHNQKGPRQNGPSLSQSSGQLRLTFKESKPRCRGTSWSRHHSIPCSFISFHRCPNQNGLHSLCKYTSSTWSSVPSPALHWAQSRGADTLLGNCATSATAATGESPAGASTPWFLRVV